MSNELKNSPPEPDSIIDVPKDGLRTPIDIPISETGPRGVYLCMASVIGMNDVANQKLTI